MSDSGEGARQIEYYHVQSQEIRNPNIEIRNNVQILKIQMTQAVKIQLALFRTLEHSYFEFVSCFVLRISNLNKHCRLKLPLSHDGI